MDAPAFAATRFVRSALQALVLYLLIIVISLMTMVRLAHAAGTVLPHASPSTASPIMLYAALCYSVASAADWVTSVAAVVAACNQSYIGGRPPSVTACPGYVASGTTSLTSQGFCYSGSNYIPNGVYGIGGTTPIVSRQDCPVGYTLSADGLICNLTTPNTTCPAHATGTPANINPTSCTCNSSSAVDPTNYVPDTAGTSCVPAVACPVHKLTTPPFSDGCAEVLENIHSTQSQKDAACGALTDKLKTGMACFSDKLSRTNDLVTGTPIPLKITSDIRSVAYQAHFREIWKKMELLVPLMARDPVMRTACAARRAEIAAEKGCDNADVCKSCYSESATQRSHCLKGMPAPPNPNDAQHTQGNAFDVSGTATISPLLAALGGRRPPETIPQFLDAPTNCNLIWGGAFKTNNDPVHFLAR